MYHEGQIAKRLADGQRVQIVELVVSGTYVCYRVEELESGARAVLGARSLRPLGPDELTARRSRR